MPKFSATCLQDLLTREHANSRMVRRAAYADPTVTFPPHKFVAVVTIEADDGSWFEMDATDCAHARRLADNAVDRLNARGASCRTVGMDGVVSRVAFYTRFETYAINDTPDGE